MTADLAAVALWEGEVEEGCGLAAQALDEFDAYGATIGRARHLKAAMVPLLHAGAVRELKERLDLVAVPSL